MITREQLVDETEELAVELFDRSHEPSFPDDSQGMEEARDWAKRILAHAKTVTAEQVEAAARVIMDTHTSDGPLWNALWDDLDDDLQDAFRYDARAAFRAAGFLIEGDDDE